MTLKIYFVLAVIILIFGFFNLSVFGPSFPAYMGLFGGLFGVCANGYFLWSDYIRKLKEQ